MVGSEHGEIFDALFQRMHELFPPQILNEFGILESRTSIQLAFYAGNGARYAEHRDTNVVDAENMCSDRPVRKFTCLYYLNPRWKQGKILQPCKLTIGNY